MKRKEPYTAGGLTKKQVRAVVKIATNGTTGRPALQGLALAGGRWQITNGYVGAVWDTANFNKPDGLVRYEKLKEWLATGEKVLAWGTLAEWLEPCDEPDLTEIIRTNAKEHSEGGTIDPELLALVLPLFALPPKVELYDWQGSAAIKLELTLSVYYQEPALTAVVMGAR